MYRTPNIISNTPALVILSGSLSAALSYALIRCGGRLPFAKQPSIDRWHTRATPDSGGLAIFAALAAVYLTAFRGQHTVAALAAAALWLLGTWDDRVQLRARTKLAAQALVVTLAVAGGVTLQATAWPWLNWGLSWLWLIGITNAFNLIDNMDGLAAGVAVVIASFRGIALYGHGYYEEAALSGVIAAAFGGFLLFNFKPARIFMGDGGSMLAGFTLAALTATRPLADRSSLVAGLWCPVLLFAYPIFDTALVSILRRAAGRPISLGGRDHSSHRLAAHGVHEAAVVTTLWVFAALGCTAGLVLNRVPAAALAVVALMLIFAGLLGKLLSTLPAAPARARGARPAAAMRWSSAWRVSVAGVVEALLAAVAVTVACLTYAGLHFSETQWSSLLITLPLVMLVHAAASALAQAQWGKLPLGGWALISRTRLALLAAVAAAGLRVAAGGSRGVALGYALLAFLWGLGMASGQPLWRPARDTTDEGRAAAGLLKATR